MSIGQPPGGLSSTGPEPRNITETESKGTGPSDRPRVGWQRRLLRISIALFTFEVGIFLVIFPWTQSWDINYFQSVNPTLQSLWHNDSFRGAITGLGLVNLYIACLQTVHSFRKT